MAHARCVPWAWGRCLGTSQHPRLAPVFGGSAVGARYCPPRALPRNRAHPAAPLPITLHTPPPAPCPRALPRAGSCLPWGPRPVPGTLSASPPAPRPPPNPLQPVPLPSDPHNPPISVPSVPAGSLGPIGWGWGEPGAGDRDSAGGGAGPLFARAQREVTAHGPLGTAINNFGSLCHHWGGIWGNLHGVRVKKLKKKQAGFGDRGDKT